MISWLEVPLSNCKFQTSPNFVFLHEQSVFFTTSKISSNVDESYKLTERWPPPLILLTPLYRASFSCQCSHPSWTTFFLSTFFSFLSVPTPTSLLFVLMASVSFLRSSLKCYFAQDTLNGNMSPCAGDPSCFNCSLLATTTTVLSIWKTEKEPY